MSMAAPPWRAGPSEVHSMPGPAFAPGYQSHGLADTAFTTVAARRNLTRVPPPDQTAQHHIPPHPQHSNMSASPPQPKKIDWPAPVRQYVQRSFVPENSIPGIAREDMERKLKHVITEAAENDTLHTIDWDALPLPQQMIQSERSKPLMAPHGAPWGETFSAAPARDSTGVVYSKKRKSSGLSSPTEKEDIQPPWRKTNGRNIFEDRITHPSPGTFPVATPNSKADKRQRRLQEEVRAIKDSKSQSNLEKRKKRFENGRPGMHSPQGYSSPNDDSPMPDAETGPVVGRNQDLEKKYFRLTAAPNPDNVRPLPVLERTLEHLKKKWRKENNYGYICDQFKSLRQDLTVQHIKSEFTVNVYEIHARIALEKGDLGEYNQCQTQLRALYSQNLGGHPTEFKAYRILYFIHTCNRTDMNDVLADLTPAEKKETAVKHALDVRSALALGNYHRFFQLYLDTPNMGAYLMDMFIVRERLAALANICKAYKPDVRLRFITEELGFESDGESVQFLVQYQGEGLLEEREDGVRLLTGKAGSIFESAKSAAFKRVDIKGQI
ncbi:MAG: hypothetical protein M1819_003171 [Sarea resinae]|nr:MAG: hypothetical protein M1819_003171 [Sarea resinae]